MDSTVIAWAALVAGLITLLLLDLLVLHRDTRKVSVRDAAWSAAGFVAVAVGFGTPSGCESSPSRCRTTATLHHT